MVMDIQNLGDDENWWGSLVGGQHDDMEWSYEALDVGGRHLDNQGIQCGLYEDDEEASN